MYIAATQIRIGMIIIYKDELCRITDVHHLTPGNKRGHMQVKMKRLKDDTSYENRFRSDDTVERATLEQKSMQYLYAQDNLYYFMDTETFEQITLAEEMLGEKVLLLLPNALVKVYMHDGKALDIELPKTVDLKVESTEAVIKGATATSSYKPARLETGITVQVPPFIKEGDIVKVDTETVKYLERVSK